jgi:nucleoside-diphosphate-sugar epimerase
MTSQRVTSERIFLTGATGVVGTLAIPLFVAQGHEVTAIGRTPEKRARLESLGARAVELDMFDERAAERALAGHTVVINLATHMPPSAFQMMLPWKWRENDHVRREGSAVLARAALAAGVRRFVQESFAPVYEDHGDAWIDESWPIRPAPYNRTVLDAERSAELFTEKGGEGIVVRFAGFYGPDAILREMTSIVKKGWSPLPGAADAYWSSCAHEDAATAVVATLGVPAGIYNVCDDEPLARRDWVDTLARAVGAKPPHLVPRWLSAVSGKNMELLTRSQRMSNAKLKSASGWTVRWPSAREGIPAMIRALAA